MASCLTRRHGSFTRNLERKLAMRAAIAVVVALIGMSACLSTSSGALAQQCNFKCTCANPAEHMAACPPLNAQQCGQAAQRASVGGVTCTGTMEAACQANIQIAVPPGSYAQTCSNCQHDCTFLLCNCQSAVGSARQSGINYAACSGHSVANVDGRLTCGK
jgi:hypothetical protein